MKIVSHRLLLLVILAARIAAFSDSGAYERLWYWYAYTLDTSGSKIAPGCASKARRCTFAQFMNFIEKDPTKVLTGNLDKVNPNDVKNAFTKLKEGKYTGPYMANKVHVDLGTEDRDNVGKLMGAIGGFIEGKLHGADEVTKQNLKQVTIAVAKLRTADSIKSFRGLLKDNHGIKLETRPRPIFEGSVEEVDEIDWDRTAESSGKKKSEVWAAVRKEQARDPGHTENVRMAKKGAQTVSDACQS